MTPRVSSATSALLMRSSTTSWRDREQVLAGAPPVRVGVGGGGAGAALGGVPAVWLAVSAPGGVTSPLPGAAESAPFGAERTLSDALAVAVRSSGSVAVTVNVSREILDGAE